MLKKNTFYVFNALVHGTKDSQADKQTAQNRRQFVDTMKKRQTRYFVAPFTFATLNATFNSNGVIHF